MPITPISLYLIRTNGLRKGQRRGPAKRYPGQVKVPQPRVELQAVRQRHAALDAEVVSGEVECGKLGGPAALGQGTGQKLREGNGATVADLVVATDKGQRPVSNAHASHKSTPKPAGHRCHLVAVETELTQRQAVSRAGGQCNAAVLADGVASHIDRSETGVDGDGAAERGGTDVRDLVSIQIRKY